MRARDLPVLVIVGDGIDVMALMSDGRLDFHWHQIGRFYGAAVHECKR